MGKQRVALVTGISQEHERRKALLKKLRGSCKHLPGGVGMFLADKHAESDPEE